ncbi:hypothetical protein ACFQ4E_08590 [Litorisediminicola beolgyonensis]|uniref:Uncharacterized protein n=1 Tax=Litorisediminicola beolgyonensis TaxID=1173614 RepID=A0ABW3ZHY3_9RHOB
MVIWWDSAKALAVIWCEDHGDLAYFNGQPGDLESQTFEAGDLVSFDDRRTGGLRRAINPRRVVAGTFCDLPQKLRSAPSAANANSQDEAEIIEFRRQAPAA